MKKIAMAVLFAAFMTSLVYAEPEWVGNWYSAIYDEENDVWKCYNKDENGVETYIVDKDGRVIEGPFEGYVYMTDDKERYIVKAGDEENTAGVFAPDGSEIIPIEYKSLEKIEGIRAYVAEKDGLTGVVDEEGNVLLPFAYSGIESKFDEGYLFPYIFDNKNYTLKYGCTDKDFNVLAEPEYDIYALCGNVAYLAKGSDVYKVGSDGVNFVKTILGEIMGGDGDYISFRIPGENISKYGKLDENIDIKIPAIADENFKMSGSYAVIKSGSTGTDFVKGLGDVPNGKFGIIDSEGNFKTDCNYDEIKPMGDGRFIGIRNGQRELISLDSPLIVDGASSWAYDSINYGIWLDIVPLELQKDYTAKITRKEFCTLAVYNFLHSQYHSDFEDYINFKGIDVENSPFDDTDDKYVVLAYRLGIVNGRSENTFAPDDFITRQEAAVMLCNLINVYTFDGLELIQKKSRDFADKSYFADWAKESIDIISSPLADGKTAIMEGTGNNKFSPWYNYSREQAIATMVRIADNF